MELTRLRTSHMVNPLGIDEAPYFSWIIKSSEKNVFQSAYRLTVTHGSKTVWDSGEVKTDQTTFVTYDGRALKSKTRYEWTIIAIDNKGNEASASAWFETAMLDAEEWKASWVVSPFPFEGREKNWGNQPPATLFRKVFFLKDKPKCARLYATCHGIYRLTINGKRPDDREFAPEYTSYHKYLCYQTYDITGLINKGENVIGMHVGDGWYCGPMTVRDWPDEEDPPHAVLFQLEVIYADGCEDVYCSDDKVTAAQGAVQFSDFFAGERYDANREIDGWDTPGASGTGWVTAHTKTGGRYDLDNLKAQIGPPIRPVATLPAVKAYTSPKGEQIIDFGQNIAGRVRMKVRDPKGTTPKGVEITIDHFEVPDKDGNYFNNVLVATNGPINEQRAQFVSDGKPKEFEPLFTFFGFRYIRVKGLPEVRAEDFTAVALSADNENAGDFECSDARLNRLYENTRWSQRSNMISIPTDCPQREKAGWTGDAHVYAVTAFLNEDMTSFFTRWLQNLRIEQAEDGRIPVVIPYPKHYKITEMTNVMLYKEVGLPDVSGWSDAAVIIPYSMYLMTGNTLILQEQYNSMKLWCDYAIKKSKKRGNESIPEEIEQYLWNTGYNLGEWMIPSLFKSGYNRDNQKKVVATSVYTSPIFTYYSLSLIAKTAAVLGFAADSDYYGGMAKKVKDAFAKGIIDKNGNMPLNQQGAYALPIYFDLVPDRHKEHFAEKLVSLIRENGNRLDTGFLGTPFLLDALCKAGREDVAYELLYQEKCPSWLDQISHGATSVWESWHCYDDDGNPIQMSMNHYAFGCIDDWMFRYIAGIEVLEPGFKRFKIHPRPDPSLSYAKRTFFSEFGEIACEWERKDGGFLLKVTVPCNTTATVILPDGETFDVGSGNYEFKTNDV